MGNQLATAINSFYSTPHPTTASTTITPTLASTATTITPPTPTPLLSPFPFTPESSLFPLYRHFTSLHLTSLFGHFEQHQSTSSSTEETGFLITEQTFYELLHRIPLNPSHVQAPSFVVGSSTSASMIEDRTEEKTENSNSIKINTSNTNTNLTNTTTKPTPSTNTPRFYTALDHFHLWSTLLNANSNSYLFHTSPTQTYNFLTFYTGLIFLTPLTFKQKITLLINTYNFSEQQLLSKEALREFVENFHKLVNFLFSGEIHKGRRYSSNSVGGVRKSVIASDWETLTGGFPAIRSTHISSLQFQLYLLEHPQVIQFFAAFSSTKDRVTIMNKLNNATTAAPSASINTNTCNKNTALPASISTTFYALSSPNSSLKNNPIITSKAATSFSSRGRTNDNANNGNNSHRTNSSANKSGVNNKTTGITTTVTTYPNSTIPTSIMITAPPSTSTPRHTSTFLPMHSDSTTTNSTNTTNTNTQTLPAPSFHFHFTLKTSPREIKNLKLLFDSLCDPVSQLVELELFRKNQGKGSENYLWQDIAAVLNSYEVVGGGKHSNSSSRVSQVTSPGIAHGPMNMNDNPHTLTFTPTPTAPTSTSTFPSALPTHVNFSDFLNLLYYDLTPDHLTLIQTYIPKPLTLIHLTLLQNYYDSHSILQSDVQGKCRLNDLFQSLHLLGELYSTILAQCIPILNRSRPHSTTLVSFKEFCSLLFTVPPYKFQYKKLLSSLKISRILSPEQKLELEKLYYEYVEESSVKDKMSAEYGLIEVNMFEEALIEKGLFSSEKEKKELRTLLNSVQEHSFQTANEVKNGYLNLQQFMLFYRPLWDEFVNFDIHALGKEGREKCRY